MAEEKTTLTITQDAPEAENLDLNQFKQVREGKTVEIPKPQTEAEKKAAEEAEAARIAEEEAKKAAETETEEEKKAREDAEKAEADKKRSKHDPKKRIEKLTRENYEKDDELERLRAEIERLKSGKKEESKEAPKSGEKPKLEDFKTYEEWVEAVADWKADQKFSKNREEEKQRTEAARTKEIFDAHLGRVKEATAKYDDFIEVVQNLNNPEYDVPDSVAQAITLAIPELEHSAEVMYKLGNDPELCKKLGKMTPLRAVAALGKINDSFDEEEKPEKSEKKSKAPEPIKPLGSSSAKSTLKIEDMSLADYKKARDEGKI